MNDLTCRINNFSLIRTVAVAASKIFLFACYELRQKIYGSKGFFLVKTDFLDISDNVLKLEKTLTPVKVSKYGVFSGPYFPVFGLNTGKYGSEKTPYLDTFHAVLVSEKSFHSALECHTFTSVSVISFSKN